jgi:hypothetical protein
MSKILSPSPILESFVRNVQEDFPKVEAVKVEAFAEAISHSTSEADSERARRCFHWAYKKADDKNQSHPKWREIKELHQEWKDTWFGAEFGLSPNQGIDHHAGEDMHIQWVEDAVTVAKTLGEEDGWDKSPWEALLTELVGMGSGPAN